MAHDVFISHATQDKAAADAVCHTLEENKIRCWIAPRDLVGSDNWTAKLIEAISESKAIVLVFSQNANLSRYVLSEVERAVSKGLPVIPYRLESALPEGGLEFLLSNTHWLDAFPPPMNAHLATLVETVHAVLGRPNPLLIPKRVPSRAFRIRWIVPAVLALAISLVSWRLIAAKPSGADTARREAFNNAKRAAAAITLNPSTITPADSQFNDLYLNVMPRFEHPGDKVQPAMVAFYGLLDAKRKGKVVPDEEFQGASLSLTKAIDAELSK